MKLSTKLVGHAEVRAMLLRIGREPARLALAQTAEDVEALVEAGAARHNGKGKLVQSVYLRRDGEGWLVGHDLQLAPHALFVHWGTGLWGPKKAKYEIKPKPGSGKKALRWAAGGRFAFAKKVMHPGIKPDPWISRAASEAPAIFAARVKAQLERIKP